MSLKDIKGDLQRLQQIIDGWSADKSVSNIERELALDKLKALYDQVMFFGYEDHEHAPQIESQHSSSRDEGEQWADVDGIDADQVFEELQFDMSSQDEESVESEIEPVVSASEPVISAEHDPDTNPVDQTPARESIQPEHSLFKPKLDRRVIMSLYGDDTPEVSQPIAPVAPVAEEFDLQVESTPEPTPEPMPMPEVEPVFETQEEPFEMIPMSADVPVSAPKLEVVQTHSFTTADKPRTQILGEVINAGEQTLGESIASHSTTTDVATKIMTHRATELRKSIGINDKFLMIRDMFAGDASAFESAIIKLEEYTDLNDALLYIHETYHWNPNSDGVKLLVELLTRKLS